MANENVLTNYPYTLGKGKILVRKDAEPEWLDLANVKECNLAIETEKLEHFSSRSGIKIKDKTVITQIKATGTIILDVPVTENVRLFFLGEAITDIVQASGILAASVIVKFNRWTEIGKESLATAITVKNSTGTITYVEHTDYKLDRTAGLIAPLEGGAILDGAALTVSGNYAGITKKRINAGRAKSQKRHFRFIADPPEGAIQEIRGFANLTPSGDFKLIGDEFQEFTITLEFEENAAYSGLVDFYDRGVVAA